MSQGKHQYASPFRVGESVIVMHGEHLHKVGVVTRLERDSFIAMFAEDTGYFVTFEGEEDECTDMFIYTQLVPVMEECAYCQQWQLIESKY
jgi:hypothetical protein